MSTGAKVDLVGGASMSFFYLLSGFVMTLGYASKPAADPSSSAEQGVGEAASSRGILDRRRFWRNRFARLFPTYLLTNVAFFAFNMCHTELFPMPLFGTDVFSASANFVLTLLGLSMWLYPLNLWIGVPDHQVMLPSNVVSWTIQTMAFFYLAFPALLPWLHSVRNRRATMRMLFCLQALTFMSVLLVGIFWTHDVDWAYWTARAWPLSRLPVFVMGCLAALERALGREGGQGTCCCSRIPCADMAGGSEAAAWGGRATMLGAVYLGLLAAAAAGIRAVKLDTSLPSMNGVSAFAWLIRGLCEALVPLLFVDLITALTRCGGEGAAARLCRSAPLQKFGDLSMPFYLVHVFVLSVLTTTFLRPSESSLGPLWVCGVALSISILLGWLLANYFEAPCRRRLRG